MNKFEDVLPKLVGIQLFSDFNKDDENDRRILKMVYDSMTVSDFAKGSEIIKEGKYGDNFYILYKGKVRVCRKTPAGDTIALAELDESQGVFFGETALIGDAPRTASVVALCECRCIALSCAKFQELCEKEPLLGYRVTLQIARRMAKTILETNNDKAVLYEALFSEIESIV